MPGLESLGCIDGEIDRVSKTALLDRQPHCRAMRKMAKDVLAPQFQRIHAELGCRDVDASLDQIIRLGLAGAAIGVDRRRVGEDAGGLKGEKRDVVHATHRAAHRHGRHGRRHRRNIGAHIGEDFCFERQEFAIPIERKARPDKTVAAVRGGNKILAAVPYPHHRTSEAACRPQHQHPFRIKHVLHPKTAADVGNADAKLLAWNPEYLVCEQIADHVRAGG